LVLEGTTTDRVVLPEPVTEDGLNVAVEPPGVPLTWKPTVGFEPLAGDTLTVYDAVPPLRSVTFPGEAESEKSPPAAVPTTSVTVVEWVRLLLVPVIVMLYVPVGVEVLVARVSVELPDPLTELGLKLALTPLGKVPVLKATVSLKLPEDVTLTP